MSDKFTVEIITPDKSILKSDATEATIPSYEGQMGILKDHISLITYLRPGIISIKNQDEKILCGRGYRKFSNNILLILTSTAKDLKNFQRNNIDHLIDEAKKNLKILN